MRPLPVYLLLLLSFPLWPGGAAAVSAQETAEDYWHGIERSLRYRPDGRAIVIRNGDRRFNRALYGGPSGFRVEAGDLPEVALYRPRLAGTLRFGLLGRDSRWLIETDDIRTTYDPGIMRYAIADPLLGGARLELEVLALRETDGLIYRFRSQGGQPAADLLLAFGGASNERFSREGDIGADPESVFYLDPEHCSNNDFTLRESTFTLHYPARGDGAQVPRNALTGAVPPGSILRLVDATQQESPAALWSSSSDSLPVLAARVRPGAEWQYGVIRMGTEDAVTPASLLPGLFAQADTARKLVADRVTITTPDSFLNTLGGALGIAADGIWEDPAYHHGAIAWRQQLVGWRGAYVADPLGWHDRGRTHFEAYAKSQLTAPPDGPVVPDTSRNLARQVEELGTAVFTEGYISRYPGGERLRAHHYDMNQVYIDALLRHLDWTGDLEMAREMWPVIRRHLSWEKRNFDADNDALYDAYCSIWASDAVQYSGGGVTHASAYHYYANRRAAELATLLGEDPAPYRTEADRIHVALNKQLWMDDAGMYAEYRDLLGLRMLHRSPAVWTMYHALDSEVPDPFQAYRMTRYVDREIPRIPIRARGLPDTSLYTISTSNWLPYTWSVNNVALAEVMHTALAYWRVGRADAAHRLWKSALMESMYLGASPGSFQQLSFYDAIRGELYRDFADPIAMVTRATIEGLYGIRPDLLHGRLVIAPGFPAAWDHAALTTPDLTFAFERTGRTDRYELSAELPGLDSCELHIAPRGPVAAVIMNGLPVEWEQETEAVGRPLLSVRFAAGGAARIEVRYRSVGWGGLNLGDKLLTRTGYSWPQRDLNIRDVYDPAGVWQRISVTGDTLAGTVGTTVGEQTFFVAVGQDGARWWEAVTVTVVPPVDLQATATGWTITNHSPEPRDVSLFAGPGSERPLRDLRLPPGGEEHLAAESTGPTYGTTILQVRGAEGGAVSVARTDWSGSLPPGSRMDLLDPTRYVNARVTDIFQPVYYAPRPSSPTVQLPVTGIGNWCYPNVVVNIDDSGLLAAAGDDNVFKLPSGLPFRLADDPDTRNIAFTSQWDYYPDSLTVPLEGRAEHAYFLLAGSTNPMQSQLDNGEVTIRYTDGTVSRLPLRNPDTWVPIEQDYYLDGYAFRAARPRPPRVHLKTGEVPTDFDAYVSIKGFSETGIDGGAATVLDLPLNPGKTLQSLTLRTLANDVVIGLLAATLLRPD
ncbi:DUF4450 domain-containing protein [Lewinella sp. IMCC34183]|uniref:DUF4450 domain-containing protein n=1 Tax=Lewinella sp. IMCC34183 TaxID=2248762 RepID=UPI0013002D15|nr:DUF4450 domain-containing protein [Lewinella sp. IMCC34183]